jgi:hypothetical protein
MKKRKPPRITNAPGIEWQTRSDGRFKALWRARPELVLRGYLPKSVGIWVGTPEELTENDMLWISTRSNDLQRDMRAWACGKSPCLPGEFDGTLESLTECYRTDPDSDYHKNRYVTRIYYDKLIDRLTEDHGHVLVQNIKGRDVKRWHENWTVRGVAMAHALVGMLRTVVNFGVGILEEEECKRLSVVLSSQKYSTAPARTSFMTSEQAIAIRKAAHEKGWPSIALAQALQFELMLRQKDVIGEWVPIAEPGMSDITQNGMKWLRGLRWEEIDENLNLSHVTSKRGKLLEASLYDAPMVMEELAKMGDRPAKGPVILFEKTGKPWGGIYYRMAWRQCADAAGVPKSVRNMDSRAGAITEATDAGATLEEARHAATHSDTKMTQRYSRGSSDKVAVVMKKRVAFRNNKGTQGA